MRLADVLAGWRPGSYEPPWTWQHEADDLTSRDQVAIDALCTSIQQHGVRRPVALGPDGRVWDGHHRIVAAMILGLDEIPADVLCACGDPVDQVDDPGVDGQCASCAAVRVWLVPYGFDLSTFDDNQDSGT